MAGRELQLGAHGVHEHFFVSECTGDIAQRNAFAHSQAVYLYYEGEAAPNSTMNMGDA
jgi:hypothetical protein